MGARGPKPTLTERDKAVLVDLYFSRCMTGTQLQMSCFGQKSRYAQMRLKRLTERGYISHFVYAKSHHDRVGSFDFDDGKNTLVYELTDLGVWEAENEIGTRIFTKDGEPENGVATNVAIRSHSIGRYLQAAEIYLRNKKEIRWKPHFVLRHEVNTPDWTIACMAGVEQKGETMLLFGINKDPHLNTFKAILTNIKSSSGFGIKNHLLLCPNQQTVDQAVDYYQNRFLEGGLLVLRYTDAQEELLFLMGQGYMDELIEEVKSEYFRHQCRVFQPEGSHAAFKTMIEYGPQPKTQKPRRSYLVDLSTGDIRKLFTLISYDWYQVDTEARYNNEVRGVFAFVRDEEQLAYVQSKLTNHKHVRLIVRKAEGVRPWFGSSSDGSWKQVERVRKH